MLAAGCSGRSWIGSPGLLVMAGLEFAIGTGRVAAG
jgi:hypothetical protein